MALSLWSGLTSVAWSLGTLAEPNAQVSCFTNLSGVLERVHHLLDLHHPRYSASHYPTLPFFFGMQQV